jgi:hypothetical protein
MIFHSRDMKIKHFFIVTYIKDELFCFVLFYRKSYKYFFFVFVLSK